jgi:Zn-dependent protease
MSFGGVTDLTLQLIGLRLAAYAVIIAVHGLAVAAAAVAMGDPGPRHDGRVSLNPLGHLDLVGLVSGVLFQAGWIRPIAIDPAALRPGRTGLAIAVAAGAAATIALAVALRAARPFILPLLPDTAAATAFALIEITGEHCLWFALLNVLPLPPLTGALLLQAAAPARSKAIAAMAPYAGVILAIAAAAGIATRALAPGYHILAGLIFGG